MSDLAVPFRRPRERVPGLRLWSDERLASLVSRGSTWAFALLYQRHHQALYRYARSIVREDADAQDVLQSAMTRALAALQSRERDLAVRPWLFRIVHNEAVSCLRARRRETSLPEELDVAVAGVEHTAEERARLATLVSDLHALAERQRAVLVMRELSGLSLQEIAGALSISPGAAKQALFEARCALQDFAEGRTMDCEQARKLLSDADGRVLRGRKIRAPRCECRACREFESMIGDRRAAFRALAPPLPAAAASTVLGRLLSQGGAVHAGAAAVAPAAAVGKSALASLTLKMIAGVTMLTLATAGTVRLALNNGSLLPGHAPARHGVHLTRTPAVGAALRSAGGGNHASSGSSSAHHRAFGQAKAPPGAPASPTAERRAGPSHGRGQAGRSHALGARRQGASASAGNRSHAHSRGGLAAP